MDERLSRSRHDRMIGGVAAGVARSLRVDPTIVRVAWVVLAFATGGIAVLVYFVLLFVMPEDPRTGDMGAGDMGAGDIEPVQPTETTRAAQTDNRNTALVLGALLIVAGGWFLVREYLPEIDLTVSWPYLAVGLGVVLVVASLFAGRRSG